MTAEVEESHRRLVPWPLTVRWFVTRGWAWGGAAAFFWAMIFLRPPSVDVPDWIPVVMFGQAGIAFSCLGFRPESNLVRYWTVGACVLAAVGRAIALLFHSSNPVGTQLAGTAIWLLVAYWCWMLALVTSQIPSRQ